MADIRIEVNIDHGAAKRVAGEAAREAVNKAGQITSERARLNIWKKDRIDTGRMVNDFETKETGSFSAPTCTITALAPYSIFQEKGTRDHGPVTAPFLVFTPKGSGTVVFAKRVRGVPAAHFMGDALEALTAADFAL